MTQNPMNRESKSKMNAFASEFKKRHSARKKKGNLRSRQKSSGSLKLFTNGSSNTTVENHRQSKLSHCTKNHDIAHFGNREESRLRAEVA